MSDVVSFNLTVFFIFVSDESTRVCLQPIRGVDGSDYINASFIDVSNCHLPILGEGKSRIMLIADLISGSMVFSSYSLNRTARLV